MNFQGEHVVKMRLPLYLRIDKSEGAEDVTKGGIKCADHADETGPVRGDRPGVNIEPIHCRVMLPAWHYRKEGRKEGCVDVCACVQGSVQGSVLFLAGNRS